MEKVSPVLVVEDEELLLSILITAVERGGVTAVGATSGGEALGLLEKLRFSAVVSDLRMPGAIGGSEIFDWVGEHRPELASRFVFVTGDLHAPHAMATQQRTGALFIEKPFRMTQLTEMIKRLIWPNETVRA